MARFEAGTGIDVSLYQRDIPDWTPIKAQGVEFVYIRATMGAAGIDDHFRVYAEGALAAGLEVGFYHLFDPLVAGFAQAKHFLEQIRPYSGRAALIPAIDFERVGTDPKLTADRLSDLVNTVEAVIEQKPVIYTAKGYWSTAQIGAQHDDYFAACPLWIANYGVTKPKLPRCWKDWAIWQYSSSGQVEGIGTKAAPIRVDLNRRKAVDAPATTRKPFTLSAPVANPVIVQPFGVNTTGDPTFYSKFGLPAHEGADFHAPHGTPVLACADGVVTRADRKPLAAPASGWPYGIQVRIEHHDQDEIYETIYAHLASVDDELKEGSSVLRGQRLGLADSTGNARGDHLHLSVKRRGATERGEKQQLGDGSWVVYPSDLINPMPLFDFVKEVANEELVEHG